MAVLTSAPAIHRQDMVLELLSDTGLLLRRDAIAAGYDDKSLVRLVRQHELCRIRQGAYAAFSTWRELDDVGRHLLLTEAVLKQYDDNVALSHASATLRHGGPTWGLDLSTVQLTHFHGGGRTSAGVTHHRGTCRVLDITKADGHWLTSPPRTVLDVSRSHGLEVGVVVADDFLHRGLTSHEELRMLYESMKDWPGALPVRLVIGLADPRSESVGETLGRLLFRRQRLPRPELQYEVFQPNGMLAGRTDWAWPAYGLLGEFDGKEKYLRYRREGESLTDAILREKRREDLLRELTGWRMVRLVWADLFRADATAARIREQLSRAA